jgi:hypothetical protein
MKRIKAVLIKLIPLAILICLYVFFYKMYMPRVNAFGCFDDCGNYISGYFMLYGKQLYSQIFFNHNPFMPFISFILQTFIHPQNIYELVLRHRQLLLVFSFLFNTLLLYRFGKIAFGFTIIYELTKFYVFGDRFLAESFIVYPLIYLVGLGLLKLQKINLSVIDYLLSAIFTWFIIFSREPYVPIAIILFAWIIWGKKYIKLSCFSIITLIILSVLTLNHLNLRSFYFDVVTTNYITSFNSEVKDTSLLGLGIINMFLYPLIIFLKGSMGYFREILILLNIPFLISVTFLLLKKQFKIVLFALFILGFLNIRFVDPGTTFYAAYHMLCWYGAFIFLSFYLLQLTYKNNKKLSILLSLFYIVFLIFYLINPVSFFHSKPNTHEEYITNYGTQIQVGTVINKLSKPKDSLFLDGFDDIIYWQAQRYSNYPYSTYTADMPFFKVFTDARLKMFKTSPPDFYYGNCPKQTDKLMMLPEFIKNDYTRLYSFGKPSCLWVKNSKLVTITDSQWKMAEENLYYLKRSE